MTANNRLEPFKKIRVKAEVFVLPPLFSVTAGEPALSTATTTLESNPARSPGKDIGRQGQPLPDDTKPDLKTKMGPA
jgi:hypothetical protein